MHVGENMHSFPYALLWAQAAPDIGYTAAAADPAHIFAAPESREGLRRWPCPSAGITFISLG